MVNDNLNLDASLKANSKNSQYLINSLKNSQELSSKLRNINKKDTKPQICIGGFDMSKLASSNKINRNILKGALTESLPSINEAKQNLLLPYAVSSKPGSRYQKVSVFD
jgi:lambda repressor-like predicted transcriptional regulator